MRALLIAGVVAIGAGLVAAPLLATRSSSNTDVADAGAPATPAPAANRAPIQQVEVPSHDGGPTIVYVGDRPGTLNMSPSLDAGAANGPTIAELQAQIAQLRERADQLQSQQSAAQTQVQLMQETNEQLRSLNAQMASAQADRQARQAQADSQQAAVHGAISGLGPALDMLTSGNGQVDDALDAADQSFPPQARRDIAAARDAIANNNLNLARGYIQTAIGDAQAGR